MDGTYIKHELWPAMTNQFLDGSTIFMVWLELFRGAGFGLLSTMPANPDSLVKIVPFDFVINNIIAAARDIYTDSPQCTCLCLHVYTKDIISTMEGRYNIQGRDIRAEDMDFSDDGPSEIVEFFKDKTILLTGATGFLGGIFIETLLRSCQSLRKIYVLIRPKKGKQIEKRFEQLFEGPNMEPMKRKNPHYSKSVHLISGDLILPDLGLDNETKLLMINEVDIIIHCGATVRFDQTIRNAAYINVRSVKDLITMAKEMPHLKSFLYISTAFSNCPISHIEEKTYVPPMTGDKLLQLVECISDTLLEKLTPELIGKWPNTYSYTKIIAEGILETEGKDLPIAIIRPSMVMASVKEPLAGWINNFYGTTGALVAGGIGVMRTMQSEPTMLGDVVPADYVINCSLAILWRTAKAWQVKGNLETKNGETTRNEEMKVYNVVSEPEAPITWENCITLTAKYGTLLPTERQVWHPFFIPISNRRLFLIVSFLLHTLPAHVVDLIARLLGKKPQMVEMYQKLDRFSSAISYFAMRSWSFSNDNTKNLWKQLSPVDKKCFEFSMEKFDWDCYFEVYVKGARVYLLKDPLESVGNGRVMRRKLAIAHYILLTVLLFLFYKLLSFLYNIVF